MLSFVPLALFAQERSLTANVQLHRDFHREIYTSTVELLGTDRLGSTFFFSDFDYASTGATLGYFEVSRYFPLVRLKPCTISPTIQYNDGVMSADDPHLKLIPRTALAGVALGELPLGKLVVSTEFLARQEFGRELDWQFTTVWYYPVVSNRVEFQGYLDWNSHHETGEPNTFQAEPQLLLRHGQWAIGTEIELSRNFTGAYTEDDGFEYRTWYSHPTLFVRLDL